MAEVGLTRRGPLDALAVRSGAVLSVVPAESRFSFRGGEGAARAASEVFGVLLPEVGCRSEMRGERAALWLGPDEWLLLAPVGEGPEIAAAIGRALAGKPHALVDIGHRDTVIGVDGAGCEAVLAAGCPLDLDCATFPVGGCTRTVFAKAGVVLWRVEVGRFRLEVARSFAPYVWRLLEEAVSGERG
ncbi:MAG: sarcosine oxidase subunit gamma [Rhodospirillales bacterium]|nr:sarcosine oxidase subunit gamma [Rhodospirillales bacterium]